MDSATTDSYPRCLLPPVVVIPGDHWKEAVDQYEHMVQDAYQSGPDEYGAVLYEEVFWRWHEWVERQPWADMVRRETKRASRGRIW